MRQAAGFLVVVHADDRELLRHGDALGATGVQHAQRVAVIQAPHFLKWGDEFLCFYNSNGIRVMTSRDGKTFARCGTPPDGNLLYTEGGRDVMVLPVGGVLHAYSTISTTDRRGNVMLRTSTDLKNWLPGRNVSEGGPGGSGPVSAESPFVVALDGYFYLFRASSEDGKTYVYRSWCRTTSA
jgi:hypothetical protein